MNRPIAVFDSGVGGFTVVRDIMALLPKENIVYVGDTARAPYGNRSAEEIIHYSDEICTYLMRYNPKLIVIACNTATALALDYLRKNYNVPIVGVINAGAKAALKVSQDGNIGVIGTTATINSRAYEGAIRKLSKTANVVSFACPLFVPLVEQGQYESQQAFDTVNAQLAPLKEQNIESLILGCTHYPFLKQLIQQSVGMHVKLIHSGYETAKQVKQILNERQLTHYSPKSITEESHIFICSGPMDLFRKMGKKWLAQHLYGRSCEWKLMQRITI